MTVATIERGVDSVTLPLVEDGGGNPIAIRGLGKPNLEIQSSGTLNPRFIDQWSGQDQYTLVGYFTGEDAYANAITLADLIKSNGGGEALTLNIDMDEFDSNIRVVPSAGQDSALTLAYEPGTKNVVTVDLALTRVSSANGTITQQAETPTATGNGPIEITDGSTTVPLNLDVTVDRTIGRPNSTIKRDPGRDPYFIDKAKAANDEFELSVTYTQNAVSTINDLVDLFRPKLTRDSLTLDFNGKYGMGAFNVVPSGSEAIRFVRQSGEKGIVNVPKINLRVVYE